MTLNELLSPMYKRQHGLALGNSRYGAKNAEPMCKQCEKEPATKEGYCADCFREAQRNNSGHHYTCPKCLKMWFGDSSKCPACGTEGQVHSGEKDYPELFK